MRCLSALLGVLFAAVPVAAGAGVPVPGGEGPVGKVAVGANGAIWYDGRSTTLDGLRKELADLKRRNGVVWYYREGGDREPPAEASAVLKLIIEHRLPVSMSTKPDYSDVVMPDGTVKPRATRPNY